MITIDRISKKFEQTEAVCDLSLTIDEGELFGFLGPNGAGKTTTMKMVAGILKPDSGTITLDGINIESDPVMAKANIGFIPDTPYLYEKLTGYEFFQFMGLLYNINASDMVKRVGKYDEIFRFGDWIHERIESYSHGMRQKVVFTAAFLHNPKVLIVDEPMVGLDPVSIRTVKQLLTDKCRQGMTVFMSTHTLEIAQEICSRVGIIHHGMLLQTGDFATLQNHAKSAGNLEEVFLTLTEEETVNSAPENTR